MRIKRLEDILSDEQIRLRQKWKAVEDIARDAGFDDDAFAYTEFSLVTFFDSIVEHCAEIAELHARSYSGESKQGEGCHGAASAIRAFKDNTGKYLEDKSNE